MGPTNRPTKRLTEIMRPSNRSKILEAAARVVDQDGVDAVTFESVCKEAGLTRSGLVYHFASREQLLTAMHDYLAGRWEAAMEHAAGKSSATASDWERYAAYVETCSKGATAAELRFLLDSASTQGDTNAWFDVLDRWAPPLDMALRSARDLDNFVARLAADGLWVHEALSMNELSPELKELVTSRILGLLDHHAGQ